ncbi:fatty acid--CoA ligase [Rhodococcus sp. 1R11]|uniref:long-chain-fatty-acid--CoA ligase n=1 Tax=Rhodococcus sp. 1R11 TaxID=2559614 RepID=UPI001071F261|nr:long-chain-fatty-acid--CoA ligase [Rhodococcus sp. 1R11]TFI40457.1 fatty acid--CoA ligase [Rhodococcus sp. 1R11]
MHSTMQDVPLTLTAVLDGIEGTYGASEVITYHGPRDTARTVTFSQTAARAAQLAHALTDIGIRAGERVATFMWNNQEHLEAYLAIACSGAILHTLNIRLSAEQLRFVIADAGDSAIIVDSSLIDVFRPVIASLDDTIAVIVTGHVEDDLLGELGSTGRALLRYEDLLDGHPTSFEWPVLDETSAAALCYTSGTTGNPKGVVYSHRSIYLHALAACAGNVARLSFHDIALPIVPMFHVNAWGIPYAAMMAGANLLLPDRHLKPDTLVDLIETHRPTFAAGVPTIFNDVLHWTRAHPGHRIDTMKRVICGGAAVPAALIEAYRSELDVDITQAWGMTETSPIAAVAEAHSGATRGEKRRIEGSAGRFQFGVRGRIVDDTGATLPRDGVAVGEVHVSGPWITGSYVAGTGSDSFTVDTDGRIWLKTGDIGHIGADGYLTLTDRSKDVIKSGGEWISSVQLETVLAGHPDVLDAAVIGVPDTRWDERPLALVNVREGSTVSADDLKDWLAGHVAKWWIPERWAFVDTVNRTGVGKYDKKLMRRRYRDGELNAYLTN